MTGINEPASDLFLVGIDGGGTHCRASIYAADGQVLGRGYGGPANPVNGLEQAKKSIVSAVEEANSSAGLNCSLNHFAVGAGLAGLHLPAMQAQISDWQHPFSVLHATTDLHAAYLGAHEGGDGAVIIIGTGFSALGIVDGAQLAIGGYGFPINAVGSGSGLGLELVKAIILDSDGVGPKTSMTKTVLAREDINSLATRTNNAKSDVFGQFASIVFEHAEQGDEVAQQLISQSAEFIDRVIQKLRDNQIARISMLGGVAPYLKPWLSQAHHPYLFDAKHSAEFGAMLYAKQQQISNRREING